MSQLTNSIVYNSGLNVWNAAELSTLGIFYDQVLLPATTDSTRGDCVQFARKSGSEDRFKVEAISVSYLTYEDEDGKMRAVADVAAEWDERNKILFDEGVLKRLPESPVSSWSLLETNAATELSDVLLDVPFVLRSRGDVERLFLWEDHIRHMLRDDIATPGIFITRDTKKGREILKGLMACSAFRFLLPRVGELSPEELLEVRRAVASTREGFSMHLQKLSESVESRIKDGDSLADVASYANSVVETQLIPDFVEFKRQLVAKRAGSWKKVLDATSKVFEIDAAPWTPKFYGELFKAIGFTILTDAEEQKEKLSNRGQAQQFMRAVERKVA